MNLEDDGIVCCVDDDIPIAVADSVKMEIEGEPAADQPTLGTFDEGLSNAQESEDIVCNESTASTRGLKRLRKSSNAAGLVAKPAVSVRSRRRAKMLCVSSSSEDSDDMQWVDESVKSKLKPSTSTPKRSKLELSASGRKPREQICVEADESESDDDLLFFQ